MFVHERNKKIMEAPLIRPHVPRHYGFREADLLPFEEGSFVEVKVNHGEGDVKEEWDVSGMRMDADATRSRHSQKWTYFLPDGRRLLCTRSRCSSSTCVHLQRKVCPNQTFEWEALSTPSLPSSPTSLSAASLLASFRRQAEDSDRNSDAAFQKGATRQKGEKGRQRGQRGQRGQIQKEQIQKGQGQKGQGQKGQKQKRQKGLNGKRSIASKEKSKEKKSLYTKKGKKGRREEGMAFEPSMEKRERGVFFP